MTVAATDFKAAKALLLAACAATGALSRWFSPFFGATFLPVGSWNTWMNPGSQ